VEGEKRFLPLDGGGQVVLNCYKNTNSWRGEAATKSPLKKGDEGGCKKTYKNMPS